MAKTDIEDAFHIVPFHPFDHNLLSFQWRNKFYDFSTSSRVSNSCNIFNAFSSALNWIMFLEYEASGMSHILNDFPFIGSLD